MAALATAAAILLTVFLARRYQPVAPPAPVVARAADVRLPPVIAVSAPPGVAARTGRETAPPRRPPRRASVIATSIGNGDRMVAGIEPLKRIAPIAIAPITQESIAPEEIALRPLNPITELQVSPLTPPDRRN